MPSLYQQGAPIGVCRGFTPVPSEMQVNVVVPHGSATLPDFGAFVLVSSGPNSAAVGRVVHYYPTGPVATNSGEDYLAELSRMGDPMSEEVRKLVLRYNMRLQLMGHLAAHTHGFEFSVGARTMAAVGGAVHLPSTEALEYLCNVGLSADDPSAVPFGHLVHGDKVRKDINVRFSVDRLKGRRTFVFARAGYGKSNLVKYLISQLYAAPPDVGLLIFDPEGEYALPQRVGDRVIPGLASLPSLRRRLSLYTDREVDGAFADVHRGGSHLNLGDFSAMAILNAFVTPEKHDQVWANWLKGVKSNWGRLVDLLADKGYKVTDDELTRVLGVQAPKNERGQNVSLGAIRNNLIPCIARLHDARSILGKSIVSELKQGRIVVVDISMLSGEDGLGIAGLIMEKVFFHNLQQFTQQRGSGVARTLVVMEEAQQILGGREVSDSSIFVRWVKEGRKYSLGAVLITQQPGAISPLMLSQGDNFFVMHLLGEDDLANLNRVNSHYTRDLLTYIRNEPIRGNCYFWSAPDQPYVIPAKVRNFDLVVEGLEAPTEGHRPEASLADRIKAMVEENDRLWVFQVSGKNELCFSRSFLEKQLSDEDRAGLDKALLDLGWNPQAGTATLVNKWGPEVMVTVPYTSVSLKKKLRPYVDVSPAAPQET